MNDNPISTAEQLKIETEMVSRSATLGYAIEVDPDVADHMGAFEETAVDQEEANESRFDVSPSTGIVNDETSEGETDQ